LLLIYMDPVAYLCPLTHSAGATDGAYTFQQAHLT